jgi:hypoxanthine-DNA glycosylase
VRPLRKRLRGFPPIADRRARILVLGSMPSEASLAAGEYYAFRHNQFWRICGALCGFPADAPYARRQSALKRARIALWDVVASCVRPGSLDADIDETSVRVNDFAAFLTAHPGIRPHLLQRPQGGVRLAPSRRADAAEVAFARVPPAAFHEPGACRDGLS